MKLKRRLKDIETCVTHKIYVPIPKVKVKGQRSKSCLSNISKITEANFTKLQGKIEHNEKVYHAQGLGSYAEDQGHSQVKIVSQQ